MKSYGLQDNRDVVPLLSSVNACFVNIEPYCARAENGKQRGDEMRGLRALAEAVILQSIEDLWSETYRRESIAFLFGDGFRRCADIAGIKGAERLVLLRMLGKLKP